MSDYQTEEKELLKSFLNRTFFRDWRRTKASNEPLLFGKLELQINSKCNLNCVYCYYNNFVGNGKELYPKDISDSKNILKNLDLVLDWLDRNDYLPQSLEIFSGEPLNQKVGLDAIEKCIDFYKKYQWGLITVPTNFSFLRSEKNLNRVLELKKYAKKNNVIMGLSASVDGKYMDVYNRPPVSKDPKLLYDDKFYDDLFTFAKNYGCGFHPMVYYNNIENWPKNFDWFQENFEKYGLPWNNIYLLEVRNDGWDKKSIEGYRNFYKHAMDFAYSKVNCEEFVDSFVFRTKDKDINNMNLFNNIGKIGRGIGCSMQTTMSLRLGDLTVNSCHRQSYDWFNGFKFKVENDQIVDVEPLNLPFYLSSFIFENKSRPYCQNCLIRNICNGGCSGAQYEAMGDPFTPIPSVCALEHGKVKAQIEWFQSKGLFSNFISRLSKDQKECFLNFKKVMEEKNE